MSSHNTILSNVSLDATLYTQLVVHNLVNLDCSEGCWYQVHAKQYGFEVVSCYEYQKIQYTFNTSDINARINTYARLLHRNTHPVV